MNESGWIPLLDLPCMVKNNQILYKFFKKSMSSKYVMVQNSAMSMKIKRNAHALTSSGSHQEVKEHQ